MAGVVKVPIDNFEGSYPGHAPIDFSTRINNGDGKHREANSTKSIITHDASNLFMKHTESPMNLNL